MNIALSYVHVVGPTPDRVKPGAGAEHWRPYHERFVLTYEPYYSGCPHTLHIVFSGLSEAPPPMRFYDGLKLVAHAHSGAGMDIGAQQAVAKEIEADFMFCLATPCYLWRNGWLRPFVRAFEEHGPGLYGAMASYERAPHIRASAFGCPPRLLRDYPHLIDSYEKTFAFETGPTSHTAWVESLGLPVLLVTADGQCWKKEDWRKPPNIFRRGDQSNCLVWDRHTDWYRDSDAKMKGEWEARADKNLIGTVCQ
jgi:hypothetical protein